MPTITLTRGHVALVDDADHARFGALAWHAIVTPDGHVYAARTVHRNGRKRMVYLHREILDAAASAIVDHIDGNTLDCRRANLRATDATGNARNRKADRTSTSAFLGVSWDTCNKKWIAQIKHDGRNRFLGRFADEKAAAAAYNAAAREHYGAFARLNAVEGATL